jgi:hypothetical protein
VKCLLLGFSRIITDAPMTLHRVKCSSYHIALALDNPISS